MFLMVIKVFDLQILKLKFLYQMNIYIYIYDNFERKICVIAGTGTTDLQFSVLAP